MFSLDHVGFIVPRLDEAARLFRTLGFTLTARADHTRVGAGGQVEPAGSAQQSVMLERGYIELQEITDPEQRHLLSPAAAKYFGLHILVFGVPDAEAANVAVRANGLDVGPVLRWGRAVREPEAEGEARFAFFVAPYAAADEVLLCWTEHLSPELLRFPRLVAHTNGARALRGIMVAARTSGEAARLAGRYRAAGGAPVGDGSAAIAFGPARVAIRLAADLPPAVRGPAWGASPTVAGLLLRLDDPADLAARARAEGLAVTQDGSVWFVDLGPDLGATLVLDAE